MILIQLCGGICLVYGLLTGHFISLQATLMTFYLRMYLVVGGSLLVGFLLFFQNLKSHKKIMKSFLGDVKLIFVMLEIHIQ
ncbi:hypothetical protein AXF15_02635 [Desulfomicrobium orale DSM 12838]|uniref:Uncharacterized protein n=1 Tax=Desulfomicrobium orale DSM 12838 TaxID=888061 RepID=A0A0X8JNS1_9BACT|nr:hypothetical protein AXF15_02635 [Desulfomicrobium orale DSM 12838]